MISGAMLNYGIADQQWEDTGYMTPLGSFSPAKQPLYLSRFEDIVYNETLESLKTFETPRPLRGVVVLTAYR